jgi:hypothetical protein
MRSIICYKKNLKFESSYPLEIYNEINMGTQMKNITYAIDHLLQKKFKI